MLGEASENRHRIATCTTNAWIYPSFSSYSAAAGSYRESISGSDWMTEIEQQLCLFHQRIRCISTRDQLAR